MARVRNDDRIIFFVMIDILTVALFIVFVSFFEVRQSLDKIRLLASEFGLKCDEGAVEDCIKKHLGELKEFRDEKAKRDARDRGGKGVCVVTDPTKGVDGKFPIAEAAIRLDGIAFRPLLAGQKILAPIHQQFRVYNVREFKQEFGQYIKKDCGYGVELSECEGDGEKMTGLQMREAYRAVEHSFLKMTRRSATKLCD